MNLVFDWIKKKKRKIDFFVYYFILILTILHKVSIWVEKNKK